ncbi:hypothetical protein PHPALM_27851 [Phytophthora palmivora]|uniref:Uncharacterized protein n=1 Tax=Phytophthora palmivora TaxID=4796 RepID=A0A2P4XBM0_9STRA|nr:hypothetical protein PHPALM_27851 [Phytophthora palmivora]
MCCTTDSALASRNVAEDLTGRTVFTLLEDVTIDLIGHYLSITAAKYYNKQKESKKGQTPTLRYIIERMLETLKNNITPAQTMKLCAASKNMNRLWPEHYISVRGGADYKVLNNTVQYVPAEPGSVLMAKLDNVRTHYLQRSEELTQFAQTWELEPGRRRNLRREVVAVTGTEIFHECGDVGHLRAAHPDRNRGAGNLPNMTLAVSEYWSRTTTCLSLTADPADT